MNNTIRQATTASDWQQVGKLMREYAHSLDLAVCFQSVEEELAALPGDFAQPHGAGWLAVLDNEPVGIVALRKAVLTPEYAPASKLISEHGAERIGEVKRMYLQPQARGHGLADALLNSVFAHAAHVGYRALVLDTRESMTPAIRLYSKLGFEHIDRYNDNPDAQVFMQRVLRNS
jgi:putative acetyltransferase